MSKINGLTQIKAGSVTDEVISKKTIFNVATAGVADKIVSQFSGENLPIVPNAEETGFVFPNSPGDDGDTVVSFNTTPGGIKTILVYRWVGRQGILQQERVITSTYPMLFYSESVLGADGSETSPKTPMGYIAYNDRDNAGALEHRSSTNILKLTEDYYRATIAEQVSSSKQYVRKATFTRDATSADLPGTELDMNLDKELPSDAELSVDEMVFINGVLQESRYFEFGFTVRGWKLIPQPGGPQISQGDKITVVAEYLTRITPVDILTPA